MKKYLMLGTFAALTLLPQLTFADYKLPYFDQVAIKTNVYNDEFTRNPANETPYDASEKYPSDPNYYKSCFDVVARSSTWFRCE